MSNPTVSTDEQLRISGSQIDQLERENARVVEQLKEVIKMNTHWQRYDSQREQYVLKLTKTNQELQNKVSDLQRQVEDLHINKEDGIKNERPKLEEGKHESHNDEDDRQGELKDLQKEEEVAALTDCIATLKEKIVELEKGRQTRNKADDDQLEMLREQVNVCVEDFKQERKDRERIHAENERLRDRLAESEKRIMENEERMYVYEEQIKQLQVRHPVRPVSKPTKTNGYDQPCCYPEDRPHRHMALGQTHNAYRHPMYFGDDLTDLPGDVEVDGVDVKDDLQDQTDASEGKPAGEEN